MANEYLSNFLSKLKKKALPSRIVFFITNKCNLSCRHCFYQERLGEKIEELSTDEIEKISLSLGKVPTLLISGGEPFLRTDLPEICKIFHRQNGTKTIFIPSNGTLKEEVIGSTRLIAKSCSGCHIIIGISLDGTGTQNDTIRCAGTFNTAAENLLAVCKLKNEFSNVSVNISTTIFENGYDEALNLFEFIKNGFPVSYHAFSPFRDFASNASFSPPTGESWMKTAKSLLEFDKYYFKKAGERGIKLRCHISIKRYIYRVIAESLNNKKWPFRCVAGRLFAVIEPDGDVKACESSKAIGNLRQAGYDFRKIWFSRKAEIARQQIKNPGIPECRHCTHSCPMVPSLICSPLNLIKALASLY